MPNDTCSFAGCALRRHAHGYCSSHAKQYAAGKELKPLRRYRKTGSDPAQWFWKSVLRLGPDDCWEWMGSHTTAGYGNLRIDTRDTYAHRYAYELANGPIPPGMHTDHTCWNPGCVNPEHLRVVTPSRNGQNRSPRAYRGATGVRNVSRTPEGTYAVHLTIDGKRTYCGAFHSLDEADAEARRLRKIHYPASQW